MQSNAVWHGSQESAGVAMCQPAAAQGASGFAIVPTPHTYVQLVIPQILNRTPNICAGKERWRVGAVVPLQPTDDSPFLGNLKTAAPQLAVEVGFCVLQGGCAF